MESSGSLSDSVLFQTSPSDDHSKKIFSRTLKFFYGCRNFVGSLGHFLYTVRSRSIPIVWGQNSVSIPDHLVRFGMTTKKSHEVDNLSNYISLFTSQLNTHQVSELLLYSGTSLIRTPMGQKKVSLLVRCPHFRG